MRPPKISREDLAKSVIQEQTEAAAALESVGQLSRTGEIDGRKMSSRSFAFKSAMREREETAARELEEALNAMAEFGKVESGVSEAMKVLIEKMKTLESQLRNVQGI